MTLMVEHEPVPGAPTGVYRRDGKYFHDVKRLTRDATGQLVYELVPREVALVNPFETDEATIHKAREAAARRGLDFYDPRTVNGAVVGWLHAGRKRTEEWPENLGSGAQRYETIPVPDDENPDRAAGLTAGADGPKKGVTHGK